MTQLTLDKQALRFRPKQFAYTIDVPPSNQDRPSVLAFSLWKAGSSLLYALLSKLCKQGGMTYVGVDDILFRQNVVERPVDVGPIFRERGYCYGGFRIFPYYQVPLLDTAKTVFLVRDPRDMVVSLYFSVRESHIVPEGEEGLAAKIKQHREVTKHMTIDEWVPDNVNHLLLAYESYFVQGFTRRPNVVIYRYEDIIFSKAEWMRDIADWYEWDIPRSTIEKVVAPLDVLPDEERPSEHIRQVRPGNYRAHLSEPTRLRIETMFAPYMRAFGYID
jgi:hypothetical protein